MCGLGETYNQRTEGLAIFGVSTMQEMFKPAENFVVYLSQTDDNCWEAKSQRIEKMLREWEFCTFCYTLQSEEEA